jgi:hypothetical protein
MKHRIISSAEDMAVILRCLSGEYRPALSMRVTAWLLASVSVAAGISLGRDLYSWTPASGDDRIALVIGMIVLAASTAVFLNKAYTAYRFTSDLIERRPLLPFGRRSVAAAVVNEGYLLIGASLSLELIPDTGAKLLVPLEGPIRDDFAKLYPEIGPETSFLRTVVDARYRVLIYGVVVAIIIGCVVVAMTLVRRGLVQW